MSLNANKVPSSGGKTYPALEAGTYEARVVQVIDFGVQPQRPYKGEEKPPCHEVMLTYELVDEFLKDEDGEDMEDKPRWMSETFPFRSLKADMAKSTKRYKALDPEGVYGGDFTELINAACNVTLTTVKREDGTERNYVGGVSPMQKRKAEKLPGLVNPPVVFLLDSPDIEVFNSFPQWIQDKMKGNINFEGSALQKALSGEAPTKKTKANVKEEEDDSPAFATDNDDDEDVPY